MRLIWSATWFGADCEHYILKLLILNDKTAPKGRPPDDGMEKVWQGEILHCLN